LQQQIKRETKKRENTHTIHIFHIKIEQKKEQNKRNKECQQNFNYKNNRDAVHVEK
jgi:hypothetical protein